MLQSIGQAYYHAAEQLVNPVANGCRAVNAAIAKPAPPDPIRVVYKHIRKALLKQDSPCYSQVAQRVATYATAWFLFMASCLLATTEGYMAGAGVIRLGAFLKGEKLSTLGNLAIQAGALTQKASKAIVNTIVVSHYLFGYVLPKWIVTDMVPATVRLAIKAISFLQRLTIQAASHAITFTIKVISSCMRSLSFLPQYLISGATWAIELTRSLLTMAADAIGDAARPVIKLVGNVVQEVGRMIDVAFTNIIRPALRALIQTIHSATKNIIPYCVAAGKAIYTYIATAIAEGAKMADATIALLKEHFGHIPVLVAEMVSSLAAVMKELLQQGLTLGQSIADQVRLQVGAIVASLQEALAALYASSVEAVQAALDSLSKIIPALP